MVHAISSSAENVSFPGGKRRPSLNSCPATYDRARLQSAILLLLSSLIIAGCSASESDVPTPADEPARTTNVSVYALRPDTLIQHALLPVSAIAWREVTLSFQEGGVVKEILADLNDPVEADQPLARLDADLLKAALVEARAGLDFQRYNHEHAAQLHADGSIPERELRAADYELKRAESHFKTTRKRLQNTVLRAPFAGRIADRSVELGQLLQPGLPAFHLVQTGRMKVGAWAPENQVTDFSEKNQVEVFFDTYPGQTFTGRIGRIGPAAATSRRVFPLEIHLDNPEGRIRPGMIGRMRAVRRVHAGVVVVPRQAVQERESGPAIFVIDDDRASLRAVELGATEGDRLIVESGLDFSERIVVKGGRDLIDGDQVRITEVSDR